MKRIIVLNGSKLTQELTNGKWETRSVQPAGGLPNGVYPA
ncbi:hypothetical protein QU487_06715 [Crenobacter sp. SG2305]|nr:KfrB domain-containing protein [Crenobacter sp. SG2305]MDN0082446.1 hypothetical protein [Crenobacter sp. SG2305]